MHRVFGLVVLLAFLAVLNPGTASEAGQFVVEETAGDALKDGFDRTSDKERYRRNPY